MSTSKKGYNKLEDNTSIQATGKNDKPIFGVKEKDEFRNGPVIALLVVLFFAAMLLFCLAIGVALVYLLLVNILPIRPSGPTNVTMTECGEIQGITNDGYFSYLGVPYSVPRTGRNRWKVPRGLKAAGKCWKGTYQALNYSNVCVQPLFDGSYIGNEDCLHMNIYSPELETQDLPVIVWIHGGGFYHGGSNMWYNTPEIFAKEHRAVVVSMDYRMGLLGFMSLEELDKMDSRGVSGNYGLLDILEVLKWVNRNIENFGGDKDKVTIMGQSAGGSAVLSLVSMPSARPFFVKAVVLSQLSMLSFQPIATAQSQFRSLLSSSSCTGMQGEALRVCLYDMPPLELTKLPGDNFIPPWLFGLPPSKTPTVYNFPVVDGKTVPMTIAETLDKNKFDYTDILFGWMQAEPDLGPVDELFHTVNETVLVPWSEQEYNDFIRSVFDKYGVAGLSNEVLQHYPASSFDTPQLAYDQINADINFACGSLLYAELAAKHHSDVFVFTSPQRPNIPRCIHGPDEYCSRYAFHMYDTLCMFNNSEFFKWDNRPLDKDELEFGKILRDAVTTFADNNIPQFDPKKWQPFMKDDSVTIVTSQGEGTRLVRNPKAEVCKFWEEKALFQWPI